MSYLLGCTDLLDQIHPDLNPHINAARTNITAHTNIIWLCPVICENGCRHIWRTNAQNRRDKETGCPYCAKPARKCCRCKSLGALFPDLAAQWDTVKNGSLTPFDVSPKSQKEIWWICTDESCKRCDHNCEHSWKATIANRHSRGCPYRLGKALCYHMSLQYLHPDIASQWHPTKNDTLKPDMVLPGSSKDTWWLCPNTCAYGCKHEWVSNPASRTTLHSGLCMYCCRQAWCIHESIVYTHPELVKEWDYEKNEDDKPENYLFGTKRKAWWKCPDGHKSYLASIRHRVYGTGCPDCKNKTEARVVKILGARDIEYQTQFVIPNCRAIKPLKFDIFLPKYKTVIEIDGPQHFRDVSNWGDSSITKRRDIYKMRQAVNAGYRIIRVYQPDIWDNPDDWFIDNVISELSSDDYILLFVSEDDTLYNEHQARFEAGEGETLDENDSEDGSNEENAT